MTLLLRYKNSALRALEVDDVSVAGGTLVARRERQVVHEAPMEELLWHSVARSRD